MNLHLAKVISTGFGAGNAPKAPGTVGTLVGIPFILLMDGLSVGPYIGVTLIMLIIGIWAADVYSKHLGVKDHQSIVWDEVVGFVVTMTIVPVTAISLLVGFVLFRFFDIVKPWPIHVLDQKLPGGMGVMLDDVLAGIFAAFGLFAFSYYVGV